MKKANLILLLFTLFLNTTYAQWTDYHPADMVVGQSDFLTYDINRGGQAAANSLASPGGLAIDFTNNKIYVIDQLNQRILRFAYPITSNNPTPELVFGQANFTSFLNGSTQNTFFVPRGICVDNTGRLWVADNYNNRVVWFNAAHNISSNQPNADGVLGQSDFVSTGSATTQSGMSRPNGVAISSTGTLFVADANNHRILRFDNAASKANGANADGVLGQSDFISNSSATTQSGLNAPSGLSLDANGRLWVADNSNKRVLRFDNAASKANGANADGVLGEADFTSVNATTSQSSYFSPYNVTVDANGRLYVIDGSRVLIYDNAASKANGANADNVLGQSDYTSFISGQGYARFGSTGSAAIVVDNTRNIIWLSDDMNNRLLRFAEGGVATDFSANELDESFANDGSFSKTITLRLSGDTFTGSNGDNFVSSGKINITNVPTGLTAVATRTSDKVVTIQFTGNATNHATNNSVSNVEIALTNSAISTGDVSVIENSSLTISLKFVNYDAGAGNTLFINADNEDIDLEKDGITGTGARTMEAWIKTTDSDGTIMGYGFLFFAANQDFYLQLNGGKLRLFINSGHITGTTTVNDGKWHHVAVVFDPNIGTNVTDAKLYVDGKLETIGSSQSQTINSATNYKISIGLSESSWNSSYTTLNGEYDEVRIWSIARSQEDIRDKMHLTLNGNETGLHAYFDFNYDYVSMVDKTDYSLGTITQSLVQLGAAGRNTSTAPIGVGNSTRQTISSTGTYAYNSTVSNTDLDITFGANPNGVLVVNYVEGAPKGTIPSGNLPSGYWIVNNFGTNTGLNMTIRFDFPDGTITSSTLAEYKLYKRGTNETGAWTEAASTASAVSTTAGSNYIEFSGIDGFSMVIPSSTSIKLPVEMTYFKGTLQDEHTLLTWQTASEINNYGFEIEKAVGSRQLAVSSLEWENIGFVSGMEITTEMTTYDFKDYQPSEGVNYYRLKQIDFDGKFEYSNVVNIEYRPDNYRERNIEYRIFPNPVINELNVVNAKGQVIIFNTLGQPVQSFKIQSRYLSGSPFKIDTKDLPKGQYILQIQSNGQVSTQSFIKQ